VALHADYALDYSVQHGALAHVQVSFLSSLEALLHAALIVRGGVAVLYPRNSGSVSDSVPG
jgi:hypothetical protein